ncbi:metallophosphoesterase [Ruminiclostridium cellulolyticum]|uniref:Metallophosphoesterase n=1 Tax=Ruminiclostridium cellulolyticum (strain ATCC 35319 / DSM 5812 / JCM 6584 / H10) TaxID=394503 RepID=B8I1H4_RUMCH|nr:metallophosphoesterase [Ruminiclostridium cellulolyticum]ACL75772.1 metallophosphoesterase [Ruminiclostridium cellulolyticum H10]
MSYIIIILVLTAFLLIYMLFETTLLKKNYINFSKSSTGLKIAHLSDLHVNHLHISKKRIIKALKDVNPDIVLITGDYIETVEDIPKALDLIKALADIFPVYLTLGNHEHKALVNKKNGVGSFIDQINQTGATVLNNAGKSISKNGTAYNIIGIDDLRRGKPDLDKAFSYMDSSSRDSINIVFSHNPDMALLLPKDKAHYFLCGHFHGGQIWMPFHLEFRILRREKLCRMGYRRGLHKINGIIIYINRGLGNVLFPLRFLSVPEIAVIQFP